ncbi:MAG: TlpA family protein disulfide reductase [Nocardioidaceae bacterium]|nr:TlpA family protein disulfide reductase [Nocardioidaceae bacterium]
MILIDTGARAHELPARGDHVDPSALAEATGWVLKPEGLCRGEVCRPLLGRSVADADGWIDVAAWADALGLLVVSDPAYDVVAVVPSAAEHAALDGRAPALELADVDGRPVSFDDLSGKKRVLVTWASWCGCRHELGAWQELQDELADLGLGIFTVALDDDPEAARPWIEAAGVRIPVAVDTGFVTAERYGITNVPSVVWVDEEDRIVKPPSIAPGDDQFRDWTGIDAAVHHDALRAWVRDGALPATEAPPARTDDEQRALAERRVAHWLFENGDEQAARAHLETARALAPWDWTIRRGGLAMEGEDTFLGDRFLAFWQEWEDAGRPGYGAT